LGEAVNNLTRNSEAGLSMRPAVPSTSSTNQAHSYDPQGPATRDQLARQLIQYALAAPSDHLSEIGSWHSHVPFAYALVAIHKPERLVELGVQKGDSYLTFCRALLDHGIDGVAIGVDTWQGDPHAGHYDGDSTLQALKEKHDQTFGGISTLLRKTFDEALKDVDEGSVDLLHIDGFHSYEAVRHDFESWEVKLSKRSIVLFHDTNVRREDFGVWKFWQELSQGRESYNFPYGNGLGVLIVGEEVESDVRNLLRLLREDYHYRELPTQELLERIGRGLDDKIRVASLNAELERVNSEWSSERITAKAELDRLRAEIENERKIAKAEFDRLQGEINARAGVSRSLVWRIRQSAQLSGRVLIESLPISQNAKVRLKYLILSVVGPLFGVNRGYGPPLPVRSTVGEASLRITNERYRDLAASARGLLRSAPERSVSIVVPVHNQLAYTLDCIEAIKENTSEIAYEIIIVDDCSSDQTESVLSARDDIIYLRNEANLGFIRSCNKGADRASKTYLCFLNNDTRVLPFWLSALVNTFELHENVGLAGSKLLYPDGRLQEAGSLIWKDGSAWNWGRSQDPNDPRYNYARHADYCSAASILIPRALFSALGGFDTHFAPAYCEDCDLAFKIRSLGLATIYQPLSQIIHFEGVSSGTDTSRGVKKHQIANTEKLAKRWAPVLLHQGRSDEAELLSDRGTVGRILVLDQITPEPDRDAGSIATLELMRALRDLGQKITFAPCSNLCDIPPYTDLLSGLGFELVILPWTKSLRQHLKERGWTYDAVLIFRPNTWQDHIGDVRKYAPQAKLIYHACDLHFLRNRRASDFSLPSKKAVTTHFDSLEQAELDLISESDLCILHSTVEKQLVEKERPGTRVICFPWSYEPRGRGKPFEQRSGIIFVGGYRHLPNVDAVKYYLESIHPLVKERLSESATFTAAGSFPPASLQAFAGPDVTVPGYVEEISPILFEARTMVAPLRYGAGVKGKIVSAMAHGLPVVTTTVGAEGMGLTEGENVLIADEPREFADAVFRLYSEPGLWHRLQQAGLSYVKKNTSRDVGLKIVAEALQQLDIPFIRRRTRSRRVEDVGVSATFGSPLGVTDVVMLAEAGKRMLPEIESVDIVAVPSGVSVPAPNAALPDGIRAISTYAGLAERTAAAKMMLAIADPTNIESIKQLSQELRASLSSGTPCLVVFAPPRLIASSEGFKMMAPFTDRVVSEIQLPFHETIARYFDLPDCECKWLTDTSLTGFPAVTMLHITNRTKKNKDRPGLLTSGRLDPG
jgi:GT2 family glycosyltransferase